MKKVLVVANGGSGRARLKNHLFEIVDEFVRAGCSVEVHTTQRRGDARRVVEQRGHEFSRIVSCGGDGTANEVLTGLMSLERRPELAVIPTGTTNDYAYSLGIPSDPADALHTAAHGLPLPIDAGRFADRYFTYVAAFGMFTRVTYETPQESKNMLGRVAYILEGAKDLLPIKKHRVRVESDVGAVEGDYITGLFSNSVSVAGIRSAFHDAKLDDGLLEVTLIKEPQNLADLQTIAAILMGLETPGDVKNGFIDTLSASRMTVFSEEPLSWTLDGEDGGSTTEVEISNCPRAVTAISGRLFKRVG